jgi:hypothetical protein
MPNAKVYPPLAAPEATRAQNPKRSFVEVRVLGIKSFGFDLKFGF